VIILVLAGVSAVQAQGGAATLARRAILPATSYVQGPASGTALGKAPINGIDIPFANQPVGSISAVVKGWYTNTWALLTDKGFGNQPANDHLLRLYLVEINWFTGQGGSGKVNILDWITFSDPNKKLGNITSKDNTRPLTGADFNPTALARLADKTLWVGDASGKLLHFSLEGVLLEAPRNISGQNGTIQALSTTIDFKGLIIALKSGNTVNIFTYNPANNAANKVSTYPLDNGNEVGDLTVINGSQALVIEQDNNTGSAAKFKKVFLFDTGTGQKTLLADLLNISDPANISTNEKVFGSTVGKFGLANPFKFPYDVSGVYPLDNSTIAVVNNNNFPFGAARQAGVADYTEFIAIRLTSPLNVDLAETQE
jgi:hypothetical protein